MSPHLGFAIALTSGEQLVYASARVAMVLYFASLFTRVLIADPTRRTTCSRGLWTAAWFVYLLHVAAAFQFVHHWSHSEAAAATARRGAEVAGRPTPEGIYFNYAFTLVWTLDVAWWWIAPRSYVARPSAVAFVVHSFLAFIVFNAMIVFAHGPTRWAGVVAFALLADMYFRWK